MTKKRKQISACTSRRRSESWVRNRLKAVVGTLVIVYKNTVSSSSSTTCVFSSLPYFPIFLLIFSSHFLRENLIIAMGVAILQPRDCLKNEFSHMKYPRNPSACPNRQKKPVSNRTRRSPPRNQATRSPPPPVESPLSAVSASVPVKKNTNSTVVVGQVRILKRGEEIPKKTVDLVVEKPDLGSTRRIGPDPVMIPTQIRKSKKAPFYAGPVTMSSPPPSDVPLPGFFTTKKPVSLFQAAAATNDLIRILRIDIE